MTEHELRKWIDCQSTIDELREKHYEHLVSIAQRYLAAYLGWADKYIKGFTDIEYLELRSLRFYLKITDGYDTYDVDFPSSSFYNEVEIIQYENACRLERYRIEEQRQWKAKEAKEKEFERLKKELGK